MPSETFTSDNSWTVPSGVSSITVTLRGEQAGRSGGVVSGTLTTTPGETLYFRFGGGGRGGNGEPQYAEDGTPGGDRADLRQAGTAVSDIVAVAGGGGGNGGIGADSDDQRGFGGSGGADTGETGDPGYGIPDSPGGGGGTQTSGGIAYEAGYDQGGSDGSQLQGGAGGDYSPYNAGGGGGGGGGWYGGAGGAAGTSNSTGGGGGGGGSNYDDGLATVSQNSRGAWSSSPEVVVSYISAPTNVSATALDNDTVRVTWSESAGFGGEIEIYRSDAANVDTSGTPTATVAAGVEQYDDGGRLDGTEYFYRLISVDGSQTSGDSNEVSAQTTLFAPTNLSASNVGDVSAELTWTANHDNGDTRVEVREDNTGSWTVDQTVAYDIEQATVTDLLNGQLYGMRVVADTGDAATEDQ